MACACKKSASSKQVTSVKQVVKKPASSGTLSSNRKNITRRVVYKRPI